MNWTAPRGLALAFTPAVAGVVLIVISTMMMISQPRAGQEGYEIPVILFAAGTFIGIHALHLWLLKKFVDRNGR